MSNVTLEIAGRSYTVACGEGEEGHIAMLGASINGKLAQLPGMSGQSEARTLLFAALLLADELHEARRGAGTGASAAPAAPVTPGPDVAGPLEMLAEKLEGLASRLEASGANA